MTATINTDALDRYARAARAAGVPRDQLENFIRGGYVAQRHQLPLHAIARLADRPDGPSYIGYGGRRGPGKTHATFAQIALDDCQRVPGLKVLFLRKVLKSARESFEDVRRKVLYCTPHTPSKATGVVEFPNGSRVIPGHFSKESDIDNYLGVEYDAIGIEEVTQLSKAKIDMLLGSMRSTKPNWRPRLYCTTNPGGIGHQHFRSTFVLPWREGRERETRFIPASADDNRYLDDGYRRWLAGLTGTLGKMWRDGDWDVAGGAYFTNWSYDRVVVPAFTPPRHWRFWLGMDYGFKHWNPIYLNAQDGDGNVYHLDEHAGRGMLIPQHAEAVDQMLARNGLGRGDIEAFVAGGDVFGTESSGSTKADAWAAEGWALQRANMNRKDGAANMLRLLGNEEAGIPCSLRITARCTKLIESIPMLLSNQNDPEDVLKVDCDEDGEGGDDFYDAARYSEMYVAQRAPITMTAAVAQRPQASAYAAMKARR